MIVTFMLACLGLMVLMWSSDRFVDWCRDIAIRLNISPMVVGLTLIAFGTSFPELVVSLKAALIGSGGLAIGNIVGSNIANTLLILGIAAVIQPIMVQRQNFVRDTLVWSGTTLAFVGLAYTGSFNWIAGVVFLSGLVVYLGVLFRSDQTKLEVAAIEEAEEKVAASPERLDTVKAYALPIVLVFAIAVGAHLAVDNSIVLARELGVSEAVIGVTFLAIGTSLPELATSIACIRKRDTQMLVGNVIGSNIFNILAVIGATALVTPIIVPPHMLLVDFPVLVAVTIASLLFLRTNWQLSRREGYVCLAGYGTYIAVVGASIL